MLHRFIALAVFATPFATAFAQEPPATPAAARPGERTGARVPLFFRETWKTVTGEHAVTQEQVSSANLELKLYGPSGKDVQTLGNADDPAIRRMSGLGLLPRPSQQPCAIKAITWT